VIFSEADFVGSATDVADISTSTVSFKTAGAEYNPEALIEPKPVGCVTAHDTSCVELFLTDACNCTVAFACTIELALETLTETAGGGGVGVGVPPPPQATANSKICGGNAPIQIVDVLTLVLSITHSHTRDDSQRDLPAVHSMSERE